MYRTPDESEQLHENAAADFIQAQNERASRACGFRGRKVLKRSSTSEMSCLTPEKQNTLSVNQDKASPASSDPLVIHWAVKPLLTRDLGMC